MSGLAHTHDAINLSQGFPDFKSDQALLDLVSSAMNQGKNQYAPMPGLISLRKQIAAKFDRLYNSTYHPEKEITVTAGATQAIFTAISAFVQKNDEVIIFNPAYDCYQPAVELNLGKSICIQLEAPHYQVDWNVLEQRFSPKTKLIIINTPHNPCGTIWDQTDLIALEKLVKGTDCIVLSDEVYEHIIFDDEQHQSACLFPSLKSQSMVVASFGKTFHNTGWKMG
ncbi:UNVERIFIED_CONTAM: hypothetical protein GTU68_054535 [Idotea baltica]|nr:hypothetical protein [Idotea baltica]